MKHMVDPFTALHIGLGFKQYRLDEYPGVEVAEDSPWWAFRNGYVECVPVDKSKHFGWVKRTERSKRWRWFHQMMIRILSWRVGHIEL
jgi:hypothetical protein